MILPPTVSVLCSISLSKWDVQMFLCKTQLTRLLYFSCIKASSVFYAANNVGLNKTLLKTSFVDCVFNCDYFSASSRTTDPWSTFFPLKENRKQVSFKWSNFMLSFPCCELLFIRQKVSVDVSIKTERRTVLIIKLHLKARSVCWSKNRIISN